MEFAEAIFRSARHGRPLMRISAWAVSSMFCALVGPFGTFTAMSFDERLLYWGGLIGVAILLALFVRRTVRRLFPLETLASDLLGAAAISVTLGPAICAFNGFVMGKDVLSFEMLVHHVIVVFTVSLGVTLVRLYARVTVSPGQKDAASSAVRPDSPEGNHHSVDGLPALLSEVEPEIGRKIRWIKADGHYLEVHTDRGSRRVLMRFRDALRDLAGLPGLQVHRSYWIATGVVKDVRAEGRRHVAVLDCGTEVPVSRGYLRDLRAAGPMHDSAA